MSRRRSWRARRAAARRLRRRPRRTSRRKPIGVRASWLRPTSRRCSTRVLRSRSRRSRGGVEPDPKKPLNVTLTELESDADGTVAKRMVKGFFVAVDKTFGWNNRFWYKTTAGLVAPSDRMYIIKPPTSQGIDFPEGVKQVGFITRDEGVEVRARRRAQEREGQGPGAALHRVRASRASPRPSRRSSTGKPPRAGG